MSKRKLYTVLSFAIMLVMSMNLVISTLHSHEHFEWNHPDDFTDTGHCLTTDTARCPISGYLLQGNITPSVDVEQHFNRTAYVPSIQISTIPNRYFFPVLGRSPPTLA